MVPNGENGGIWGSKVRNAEGRTAFVPGVLPPPFTWTDELVKALSDAAAALGGVNSIAGFIPNSRLLVMPFLRVEAVLSSRIENTVTTVDAVMRAESSPHEDSSEATQLVVNYVRAMRHGMFLLKELPLCQRLVQEVHRELLRGVRGQTGDPGNFRRSQVYVGPYVPPPPDRLADLLHSWELFVQAQDAMPPLLRMGIMHAQFEMIHPFLDGNGRVGRLLMSLFLMERGCLDEPLLFLSQYLETNRREYYDRLRAISENGDWQGWFLFILEAVRAQADWSRGLGRSILRLRDDLRAGLQTDKATPNELRLIDELFLTPYMTPREAESRLGVTHATASKTLATLEGRGIVEETTGQKRNRQYRFPKLLELLRQAESPEPQSRLDL